MFYADNYGLPKILMELEKFYQMHPGSDYFRPSALLKKCVGMGVGVQEYYRNGYAESQLKSRL